MPRAARFTPELFRFLRELAANNRRDWFHANKERYEAHVRGPMLRFIADFAPLLRKISRSFVADPSPVGGSLFRIHRDIRFSKDKSPYKTAAAAHFRHAAARDVHAPGFYLHLSPGSVFMGVGLWHPDPPALAKVRSAIVAKPARWGSALAGGGFKARFALVGEALARPPRGFDPEHPLIEDLKRTDFVATASFSEKAACAPDFLARFAEASRLGTPLVRFLTEALELPF